VLNRKLHIRPLDYALQPGRIVFLQTMLILSFSAGYAQQTTQCEIVQNQEEHGIPYVHKMRVNSKTVYIPVRDTIGIDRVWLYKNEENTPLNAGDTLAEIIDFWVKDDQNWLIFGERQDAAGIHYIGLQMAGGKKQYKTDIVQIFYDYFDSAGYIGIQDAQGAYYVDTMGQAINVILPNIQRLFPMYHLSRNIALAQSADKRFNLLVLQGNQAVIPPDLSPDLASPDKITFDRPTAIFSAHRAAGYYYLKMNARGNFLKSPDFSNGDPFNGGNFTRVQQGNTWQVMDRNFTMKSLSSSPDSLGILQFFADQPNIALTQEFKTDSSGNHKISWVMLRWISENQTITETPLSIDHPEIQIRPLHVFPDGPIYVLVQKNADSLAIVDLKKKVSSPLQRIPGVLDALLINPLPGSKSIKTFLLRVRDRTGLGHIREISMDESAVQKPRFSADSVFRSSLLVHRYLMIVRNSPKYTSKLYDLELRNDMVLDLDPRVQFILSITQLSCDRKPRLAILETLYPKNDTEGVDFGIKWLPKK
jgi:hypothetical protein